MPIEYKREGTTCDWCGKTNTKCTNSEALDTIGKILLCEECVEKDKRARETKCKECDGLVWENGGLRKHDGEKYCLNCCGYYTQQLKTNFQCVDETKKNISNAWLMIGSILKVSHTSKKKHSVNFSQTF